MPASLIESLILSMIEFTNCKCRIYHNISYAIGILNEFNDNVQVRFPLMHGEGFGIQLS